jgi:hypothetical protein
MASTSTLRDALEAKKRLEQQIVQVEKQIYELEGHVLGEQHNIVAGFSGLQKGPVLTPASVTKAAPPVSADLRVFSLSSLSSPLGERPWPAHLPPSGGAPHAPASGAGAAAGKGR